jgi:hypothetical protein
MNANMNERKTEKNTGVGEKVEVDAAVWECNVNYDFLACCVVY